MSGEQYASGIPSLRQRQRAGALTLVLGLGSVIALMLADTRVPHSQNLLLVTDTARLLLGVVGSVLLFGQYRVTRVPACLALAAGFLLTSLTTSAQLLRELQGVNTDLRLLLITDLALPAAMIAQAILRRPSDAEAPRASKAVQPNAVIAITVTFAALVVWVTAATLEPGAGAPAVQASTAWRTFSAAVLGGTLVAAMTLLWQRRSSLLDLWFMVALAIWFMDAMLRAVALDDAVATWHFGRFYRVLGLGCVVFALLSQSFARFARFERRRADGEKFIDGVADELSQPLCGVTANADAISRLLDRNPPDLAEIRAAAADIVNDAERASETLRRARHLAAVTHEPPAVIDVGQLVAECLEHLRAEMHRHRVICEVHTSGQLPGIRGVRGQLLQLLLNLVGNSMEALSRVQHRERRLRVGARLHGNHVAIWVEAWGADLLPQAQLRLAWCQSVVAAHGGELSTAAGASGGATFRLVLPSNS